MIIDSIFRQLLKASLPISITDDGISIVAISKERNALSPIRKMLEGIVTAFRLFPQPAKVELPIATTLYETPE